MKGYSLLTDVTCVFRDQKKQLILISESNSLNTPMILFNEAINLLMTETVSSTDNTSMPIEEVFPLVKKVETFRMSENDISEVTCDVGEMSDNSLEVTRSCDPTISMPIEKVYPLDVDSSSKAVATEATCNVCVNAISEVTCDIGEMSDHSLAVTDSSFLEQALMGNSIMETEEALAVRPWQGLRGM